MPQQVNWIENPEIVKCFSRSVTTATNAMEASFSRLYIQHIYFCRVAERNPYLVYLVYRKLDFED